MRVYRFEDDYGTGVYNLPGAASLPLLDASCGEGHPAPNRDGLSAGIRMRYVCGFASLEQALAWMGPVLEALRETLQRAAARGHAVRLNVYEASPDQVLEGGRQVMFCRESSRLVETFDPEHVFSVTEPTPA